VRQITVLNLGRNFAVKQDDWPLLCARLEQLLQPQDSLLDIQCADHLERTAQQIFGQLVARAIPPEPSELTEPAVPGEGTAAQATTSPSPAPDFHDVDIDTLQQTQPRSVGIEHVALHALEQVGFVTKLAELGINGVMRAAILGNLIGRMAEPASELATWHWLQSQSALGELIDVDFNRMSHMGLYRASDLLMRHRAAIEDHLFSAIQTLFSLEETVTLYDLTNTYFEGAAGANPKARHGRSKEKRSDCPLVTLGLVLDGSGFVRRSRTFDGNVTEGITLAVMLTGLGAPMGALVIMDAGIATEANLAWLVAHGYRYLVVRRAGARQFDATQAIAIETAGGQTLRLQKELSEDGQELRLYCHSPGREAKESAMVARFTEGFEAGLRKIAEGLSKPRSEKRHDKLLERIGRLKEKSRGASQHYTVTLVTDASGKMVTALTWEKSLAAGTMATHPGVYCLRSNELNWDEERLWRTYTMLTDLESVFRSLKSELGLRPVFHSKEDRSDGHLFITVLAYQCVQVVRTQLKAAGINGSWASLRKTLAVQQRVTASLRRKDGRTIHVRKATVAEPDLRAIYDALAINPTPGGTKKLIS
jgi:transposase